jgi:hypothetical protein
MTAKEKANQLVNKFIKHSRAEKNLKPIESAKQCALIAVDEIMMALTVIPYGMQYLSAVDYWQNVKQEIEKL